MRLLALAQRLFGGAAVGDVGEVALQEERAVLLVAHGHRLVAHPDRGAVRRDQPVLHPEVLAQLVRARDLGENALAILRVQARGVEVAVGAEPVGDREAEHRLDLRAHVARPHRHPRVVDVRRDRQLLDERAVLRLGLAHALVALVALRDVAQRDREEERAGDVDARDRELGGERAQVGADRVHLEPGAEQRARAGLEHGGELGAMLRGRSSARGSRWPIASLRVQPNVSSVAGFTSVTRPSWSTITTQSSAARRIASLRPSLVASARSERLRAVTSTISAITPTNSPCAVRGSGRPRR